MKDAPAHAGAARRGIDWQLAARLLGDGRTVHDVAQHLGCTVATLRRRIKNDQAFVRDIEGQRTAAVPEHRRLDALRRQLHDAIESEVRQGNVRVILWLADRMKLIQPEKTRTPEDDLNNLIEEMTPDELIEFEGLRERG